MMNSTLLPFYIFCIVSLFCLNACIVEESFHFREDFSGEVSYQMNLKPIYEKIEEMDLLEEKKTEVRLQLLPTIEKRAQEHIDIIKEVEGIHNIKTTQDKENLTIRISWEFDNLEALNQSYIETESEGEERFFQKGNSLFVNFSQENNEQLDESFLEILEQIDADIVIHTLYSFDKKVQKVKKSNAKHSNVRKTKQGVHTSINLESLLKQGGVPKLEIKLKP